MLASASIGKIYFFSHTIQSFLREIIHHTSQRSKGKFPKIDFAFYIIEIYSNLRERLC